MQTAAVIGYLQIPLRAAPLLVIVTFTVLLAIAQRAVLLLGLPLTLILVSWFFKYSFALLDCVIEGRREPPTLSAEMVNPVEQRPFGMLLLMIGFYVATLGLESSVGAGVLTTLRIAALTVVPAMIAAMSITGRFIDALNPAVVFGIIARIPLPYLSMLAVIAVLWLAPMIVFKLTGAASVLPAALMTALGMYLWLAMLACIGGIVYEHRHELDYTPVESPERSDARQQAELERERDRLMDPIFAQCRAKAFANAGAGVRKLIDGSPRPIDEFRWLYARASRWPDSELAEYLVQLGLPLLLRARANDEALDRVRERLRANDGFRPAGAAQLLHVAVIARQAGDLATASALLSDFERRFPNDPGAAMARKLHNEIAAHL